MDEFYTKLAEILEVDEVKEDSRLESFPAWDRNDRDDRLQLRR
jgi:hypothetical protein